MVRVRRWRWLVLLALLCAGLMWLFQLRFTPEAAVRTMPWIRGNVVQSIAFPGGKALLLGQGETYYAPVACRWALVLWQPCGSGGFAVTNHPDPVVENATWSARGSDGWGVSVLAGAAIDPRIAAIRWGDQTQSVSGERHFLFARRTHQDDMFAPAFALDDGGQTLYVWSRQTLFKWQPATGDL